MFLEAKENSVFYAAVGNYISVLPREFSKNFSIDLGLEGGVFLSMENSNFKFPLETIDGLFGVFFETKFNFLHFQTRISHTSAHIADGSKETAITYSREFTQFRLALNMLHYFYVYTGISFLFHTIPETAPLGFQAGFNLIFETSIKPFIAIDTKWCGDTNYRYNLNLQVGIIPIKNIKFYYAYYNGFDLRGQFYYSPYISHSLGLGIVF